MYMQPYKHAIYIIFIFITVNVYWNFKVSVYTLDMGILLNCIYSSSLKNKFYMKQITFFTACNNKAMNNEEDSCE